MTTFFRLPHGFIRRNLSILERIVVTLGLVAMLYELMSSLPAYPLYWDVAILIAVFAVGLWSTPVVYFVAVAAAVYPLYSLSLYLAVLFLAIAIIGQHIFINNLGATLLVLATPWLATYQLAWMVPILGGLWWGASGGAWIGAMAALWGKLMFGMSAINPDWLLLMGQSPSAPNVVARFSQTNSLETLTLLLAPISTDTTTLLYHLLQILIWVLVAALLGIMADRASLSDRHPWPNVLLCAGGGLALLLAHIAFGFWLGQHTLETLDPLWGVLAMATLFSALAAGLLEILRDFFDHPLYVHLPKERPAERYIQQPRIIAGIKDGSAGKTLAKPNQIDENSQENEVLDDNREVASPNSNQTPKSPSKSNPDDLIMLELD
jgi:hypothetical protein